MRSIVFCLSFFALAQLVHSAYISSRIERDEAASTDDEHSVNQHTLSVERNKTIPGNVTKTLLRGFRQVDPGLLKGYEDYNREPSDKYKKVGPEGHVSNYKEQNKERALRARPMDFHSPGGYEDYDYGMGQSTGSGLLENYEDYDYSMGRITGLGPLENYEDYDYSMEQSLDADRLEVYKYDEHNQEAGVDPGLLGGYEDYNREPSDKYQETGAEDHVSNYKERNGKRQPRYLSRSLNHRRFHFNNYVQSTNSYEKGKISTK